MSSGDGYLVMEGKEFNKRVRDPHTNEVDFKEFSSNGKIKMSLVAAGAPRPFGQGLAEAEGVGQVPAGRQIHTGNFLIQIHTEKFQGNLCLFEIFLISL